MPTINTAGRLALIHPEPHETDISGEQRQVVAALEWDSIYYVHKGLLEHLSISREHYVEIAKSLTLDAGESLIAAITKRGLGIWGRRSTLGLDLLPIHVDVVKFYKYLATDIHLQELETFVIELERERQICAIPLNTGFFFCRTKESHLSSLDDRAWRSAIGERLEGRMSWLSAI